MALRVGCRWLDEGACGLQAIGMSWATSTSALVVVGVGFLVATIGQIHNATDEDDYFRLSIRFWAALAGLGVVLVAAFVHPVLALRWLPPQASTLTMALVSLPVGVVIVGGLRNAISLVRARRRRRRALDSCVEVEARVVERQRRLFGHDILAITVEAEVPDPRPAPDLAYRTRRPDPTRTLRVVETCPGDQWSRFAPGSRVRLRLDPADPAVFAVLLFEPVT